MAQRLVRRLCEQCKEAYRPDRENLPPDFPLDALGNGQIYRPKGCRACRQLGYSGRLGMYELLVSDQDIRQLAHDRASSWKIKQAAMEKGMTTLRQDGWRKVLAGVTSMDEVLRVTKGDRDVQYHR
jgi:general secretion pathway protein E/type IV pilus assembly protein PilB